VRRSIIRRSEIITFSTKVEIVRGEIRGMGLRAVTKTLLSVGLEKEGVVETFCDCIKRL